MEKNKISFSILMGVTSGLIFWLSWPLKSFPFLIFLAFIPLLLVLKVISANFEIKNAQKLFISVFISMLIFNASTSFWIYKATLAGSVATIILNSLMMTLPFILYHKMNVFFKKIFSPFIIVVFWIALEYLFLIWDLAWPWLNLGNVFSTAPKFVQWYEFTGTLGGTLWIWIVNIVLFKVIEPLIFKHNMENKKGWIIAISVIVFPMLISLFIKTKKTDVKESNIVIVQPNIDPYNEKFASGTFEQQFQKMLNLTKSAIDSLTILIVWPETAMSIPFDEKTIESNSYYIQLIEFLQQHRNATLLTGIDSYRFFEPKEKISPTARFYEFDSSYYDAYNAAMFISKDRTVSFYHKSILVPGVEKMPYPKLFKFLQKLTINLGGTSGSLGKQDYPSIFKINDELIVAPVICYESVFGEYIGKFVQLGANIITVMTNDGWWGNTPGHKQHFYYARLRAIEHRKFIVRSANTGISGFIDPDGNIINKTEFWTDDVIKVPVSINNQKTFYTKNGDYLGRMAAVLSLVFMVILVLKSIIKKEIPVLG